MSTIVTVDGFDFQYRDDEYINLTKMCKQCGKELKRFLALKDTKEKLKVLEAAVDLTVHGHESIMEKRIGGVPSEQGTYGHPIVAIYLANWLSPDFALAAASLVHRYFKADVSLATNILDRTTELTSEDSRALGERVITKSADKDIDWIEARSQTRKSNKTLNAELAQCPNISRGVYAQAQNAMIHGLTGSSITQLKNDKGLAKSASIREKMDTDELITLAFTEMLAAKRVSKDKPSGDKKCAAVCGNTAKMVKSFSELASGESEED